MGSQIVFSESEISHPILVYLSRKNNSQAQARRFQLWQRRSLNFRSFLDPSEICWRVRAATEEPAPRDSLNFRRSSLLPRNEFESGTFTIVLHATSSFTYVSVIYGANFPFNLVHRRCPDAHQIEKSPFVDREGWQEYPNQKRTHDADIDSVRLWASPKRTCPQTERTCPKEANSVCLRRRKTNDPSLKSLISWWEIEKTSVLGITLMVIIEM